MLRNILAGILFLSASSAFAIGDAGCGLGSLVIKDNSKMSQTLAMTTNASTWTQFFGITTGTSNCTASKWVSTEREATIYAETNMPSLKVDMARGEGESLTAFAQILGCQAATVPAFNEMVKSGYGEIFSSEAASAEQVVMAVRNQMNRSSNVSKGCAPTI